MALQVAQQTRGRGEDLPAINSSYHFHEIVPQSYRFSSHDIISESLRSNAYRSVLSDLINQYTRNSVPWICFIIWLCRAEGNDRENYEEQNSFYLPKRVGVKFHFVKLVWDL